ncbi:hypothetical protein WR25_22647 [Diploscapter pachys]|uniref:RNA-directed DNA polymerase n=1 Tax=Diploscapter pachys TaxID=2018661 RepID=A0A2A2LWY5_9BILA|nr:hypothetical protein WR25_22647 [Diploscapter pachys]
MPTTVTPPVIPNPERKHIFNQWQKHQEETDKMRAADVNTKIQYATHMLRLDIRAEFTRVYTQICHLREKHLNLLWAILQSNPTEGFRALTGDPSITAERVGLDTFLIRACTVMIPTTVHYDHRINNTCYKYLPVQLNDTVWYAPPGSRDLVPYSEKLPCTQVAATVYADQGEYHTHIGKIAVIKMGEVPYVLANISQRTMRAPLTFTDSSVRKSGYHQLQFATSVNTKIDYLRSQQSRHARGINIQEMSENIEIYIKGKAKEIGEGVKNISENLTKTTSSWFEEHLMNPITKCIRKIATYLVVAAVILIVILMAICYLKFRLARIATDGAVSLASTAASTVWKLGKEAGKQASPHLRRAASGSLESLRTAGRHLGPHIRKAADTVREKVRFINRIEVENDESDDELTTGQTSTRNPRRSRREPTEPPLMLRRNPGLLTYVPTICMVSIPMINAVAGLPIVNLNINNAPIQTLLDSGSNVSILRESTLQRLGIRRIHPTNIPPARAANGSRIAFAGEVMIPVKLGNNSYEQKWLVASNDSCPEAALAGCDFIDSVGGTLTIDTKSRTAKIGDTTMPLLPFQFRRGEREILVIAAEKYELPPNSDTFFPGKLPSELTATDQKLLIEPSGFKMKHPMLLLGKTLVREDPDYPAPVRILNMSGGPIMVEKGEIIAVAKNIQMDERICAVYNPETDTPSVRWEDKLLPPEKDLDESQHILNTIDLSKSDLKEEDKEKLRKIITRHVGAFVTSDGMIGEYKGTVKQTIDIMPGAPIPRSKPYRVPIELRSQVESTIKDLLRQGIIRPSTSPFSAPVVIVKKKDGSIRLCIDYTRLNRIIMPVSTTIPRTDDLIEATAGNEFFTTMDLRSGFFQIPIDERDIYKTAFTTLVAGHFEFLRTPMGLASAPATFQRAMEEVRRACQANLLIYLDDLIIASHSPEAHLADIEEVLSKLEAFGLKLHAKKCSFAKNHAVFLGHRISKYGIRPEEGKLKAIKDYPRPRNVTEVRAALGLFGYFRKFVRNFSLIAHPLHELLKADTPWQWNEQREKAFQQLKQSLIEAPVLAPVRPGFPYRIESDASLQGIGAVLLQEQSDGEYRPIAYTSRALTKSEKNYAALELEALAVSHALEMFRHNIMGAKKVEVWTDHKPLHGILGAKDLRGRLLKFQIHLLDFPNIKIVYRAGKANAVADALSRYPVDPAPTVNSVDTPNPIEYDVLLNDIRLQQQATPWIAELKAYLERGEIPKTRAGIAKSKQVDNYSVKNDIVYLKAKHPKPNKIILGEGGLPLKDRIISILHNQLQHLGFERTYEAVKDRFVWTHLRPQVLNLINACPLCQKAKTTPARARYPRACVYSTPTRVMERVHVDIFGPLPVTVRGSRYVLTAVDALTKFAWTIPMPDQKSETIIAVLLERLLPFGMPTMLVSDRGTNFTSAEFEKFLKMMNISHNTSTPYHHQTNGLVERFNKTFAELLRTRTHGGQWDIATPVVCYAYNASKNSITKYSPYALMFGREVEFTYDRACQTPFGTYADADTLNAEISKVIHRTHKSAAERIDRASKRAREATNMRMPIQVDPPLRPGDLIYEKENAAITKLDSKWKGPFPVLETQAPNITIWVNGKKKIIHESNAKRHL